MQKEAGEMMLREFAPAVRLAASEMLKKLIGMQIEPADVRIPGKHSDVDVSLGMSADTSDERIADVPSGSINMIGGIPAFSGAVTIAGRHAALSLDDRLLAHYCRICALTLDPVEIPERIAIPAKGVTADGEAAPYAAALLLCRSKAGKPYVPCRESRNALIRCLTLADPAAKRPGAALASAVRSVLNACISGKTGGEEALAMAKMLAFAENEIR